MTKIASEPTENGVIDSSEKFLKGVAISVWQNSGDNGSNWTRFAKSKWPFSNFGISAVRGAYNIGKGSDFWNRFKEDLDNTKKVGCTSFRFSFEWARIEPKFRSIDKAAIARYHEMLDYMEELGLEPNVTLWHFVHPTWFEELGGWTVEENIPYFAHYSKVVFNEFKHRIKFWATFNEPTCYMFLGWIVGMMPPAYIFNLMGAGNMLSNMLKAHTATYKVLKAQPDGAKNLIGLVHHHITFTAQDVSWLHLPAKLLAEWLEYWWGWDVVDHWMLTGEFEWKLPVYGTWIKWKGEKPPCDWWGINYYSRCVMSWTLSPSALPSEVMSDMYYPIYPEGLYQAVKRSSRYGIPMYITETGIADSRDDRRPIMIDAYFREALRCIADGYDLRGIYFWTLIDNFEWAMGWTMKFGLYAFEPDGSVDRQLKEGGRVLARFYKTLPDEMSAVRETAIRAQKMLGGDLGIHETLEPETGTVKKPTNGITNGVHPALS